MNLAYVLMGLPYGVPYTLDQAYPFVHRSWVAFGFPDILFRSDDAFGELASCRDATAADVILGLFPADRAHQVDMVELDGDGRVRRIICKPMDTSLRYSWAIALWSPVFADFMHEHLATTQAVGTGGREATLGDVIDAAAQRGMKVAGIVVSDQSYLDIGTPEDLVKAVKLFSAC
jgi:glucose-1-phosphate thymidylyltransferase